MFRCVSVGALRALERISLAVLLAVLVVFTAAWFAPVAGASDNQSKWEHTVKQVEAELEKIPAFAAEGNEKEIENSIRRAYYENYQVSGLQAEISHRLGSGKDVFKDSLIQLRKDIQAGKISGQDQVKKAVDSICADLSKKVKSLKSAKEVSDRWTRIAKGIQENAQESVAKYLAGKKEEAYRLATDAYLGHYESMGLEKATIALISLNHVTDVEAAFRQLRVVIKDDKGEGAVKAAANKLIKMVTEDAAKLDKMTSKNSAGSGWGGFVSAFIVLLREGAEALLVIAAVITYLMKSNRRGQLPGVIIGVVLAILVSAVLAVLFSVITASTATGFSQELIEGVAGIAAVLMLIYVSNWILSKSHGKAWDKFIKSSIESKSGKGAFSLWTVAFLAVLREGSETILFFQPIFAATKTHFDRALVWFGVLGAAIVLAILFVAVWVFGVRLPLRPFFQWTSFLLAFMAVTITGGAIKELQDAFPTLDNILNTPLPGVPTVSFLGLHPSVQTIVGQVIVAVILIVLAIVQHRLAAKPEKLSGSQESEEKTGENVH